MSGPEVITFTYATYILSLRGVAAGRGPLGLLLATGEGTTPTSDGGPWFVEYFVPERAARARCSDNAAQILWRAVRDRAPAVFLEACRIGIVPRDL